jgi:hypothetical protein
MNIVTNDGGNFQIDLEIAQKFKVISDMHDVGPIPIPNVNSWTFKRLLKFAREGVVDCPDPWLIKDPDYATLFEVARAADYLNYQECLDHVSQIIATSLQGKSPQEIRRILG